MPGALKQNDANIFNKMHRTFPRDIVLSYCKPCSGEKNWDIIKTCEVKFTVYFQNTYRTGNSRVQTLGLSLLSLVL